jgi:hypothetical protein
MDQIGIPAILMGPVTQRITELKAAILHSPYFVELVACNLLLLTSSVLVSLPQFILGLKALLLLLL